MMTSRLLFLLVVAGSSQGGVCQHQHQLDDTGYTFEDLFCGNEQLIENYKFLSETYQQPLFARRGDSGEYYKALVWIRSNEFSLCVGRVINLPSSSRECTNAKVVNLYDWFAHNTISDVCCFS
eukprot:m.1603228 g.1603228  ORF g.1603228 m.1603228 type:complete len:123 (+) comp25355_c1_seq25:296-664(+)